MITDFFNKATEDIYNGKTSKEAQNLLPAELVPLAQHRLDFLNNVDCFYDLKSLPELEIRVLHGRRKGQCSIKIAENYYICFAFDECGYKVERAEITKLRMRKGA